MFEFLKKMFRQEKPEPVVRRPVVRPRPASASQAAKPKPVAPPPEPTVKLDHNVAGRIEDGGPGKNVLVRTKYQREDTGTHDTLKIIDDEAFPTTNEDGIDPYNTGKFDRSKHWDKRSRS